MDTVLRILLLEDLPTDAELVAAALARAHVACDCRCVDTEADFLAELEQFKPHVILSDFSLPGFDGLSAMDLARERQPDVPFIFVSGTIGEERAIDTLKRGATDYVLKGNLARLPSVVMRAVREAEESRRRARQQERIDRLARIRAVQGGISSAIVRIRHPRELFREACAIAVERGQFRFAWVGEIVREASDLKVAARHGHDAGYLEEVASKLKDESRDNSGIGRALTQRNAIAIRDIEHDARFVMKEAARARGYGSMIALPLVAENRVIAVFKIYAADTGFFDVEETKLLGELAGDMSFALDYMAKQEKLSHLAYHDALTGLANRQLLHEHLKQEIAHAHRLNNVVAVVFIDLDRFKTVNDTFGHSAGDGLLKEVSIRIMSCTREGDIVARLGGDEFVMVLPNQTSEDSVKPVIQRVLETVSGTARIGGRKVDVSCSVGVALYPRDGRNAETLLRNADAAMYRAKKLGPRNFHFYTRETGSAGSAADVPASHRAA